MEHYGNKSHEEDGTVVGEWAAVFITCLRPFESQGFWGTAPRRAAPRGRSNFSVGGSMGR
jgi:hypothetical protein